MVDSDGVAREHASSAVNQRQEVKRTLSFYDGIAIILGVQIGSGIFASPALVVRHAQSEAVAALLWCIGGGLAWACAACFIELGTLLPLNGGPQEFIAHCFGDMYGFIAGWSGIFAVKPCSSAILAVFISDYLCSAFELGGGSFDLVIRKAVALAVIAVIAAVNCTGNKQTNLLTKVLLACKITGVGFVILAGFFSLFVPLSPPHMPKRAEPGPLTEPGVSNYTDALLSVMWAYSGWEAVWL